jgi:multiple sugar transport system substrate-binding protein
MSLQPYRRRSLRLLSAAAVLVLGTAGCSGSGASQSSGPVTLTFWTWVPHISKEISLFERTHPGIKVKVVDAGQGAAEYQKLRIAYKAGSGAPDDAQIEYQTLPSFEITNDLADLVPYGANKIKNDFVGWTWQQVSSGGKVYAIPQDTGPMGLLYRKDIFTRYGIQVPRTWAQFAAAAAKLHAANPKIFMTNLPPDDPGEINGLFWQAGSRPFSIQGHAKLSVAINDQPAMRVASYWQQLTQASLISTDPDFTSQWYSGLATGRYATWITAAWGPLFLSGSAKNTAGDWRVAPLPQWTAGQNVSANWGGSTTAVSRQSQHPQQAAELAMWLNHDPQSTRMLADTQSLYPSLKSLLASSSFKARAPAFYGGQHVNSLFAQISGTVPANFQWSPFQDYAYSEFTDVLGKAMTSRGSWTAALTTLQGTVTRYAKSQGFAVTGG